MKKKLSKKDEYERSAEDEAIIMRNTVQNYEENTEISPVLL